MYEHPVDHKECSNCSYVTDVKYYRMTSEETSGLWLCEVCAETSLHLASWLPDGIDRPGLFRSLGWIVNRLLDEIRKGR